MFEALWDDDAELGPGGSVSVPVVFVPDTVAYFTGTLSIGNSADDNAWVAVRGSAGMTAADPAVGLLPESVELRVWPNPGNAEFRLGYDLDHAQDISLSVYDLTGRLVEVIEHGRREAGTHVALWSGAAHASGLYFARLTTDGGTVKMKKVMLIK